MQQDYARVHTCKIAMIVLERSEYNMTICCLFAWPSSLGLPPIPKIGTWCSWTYITLPADDCIWNFVGLWDQFAHHQIILGTNGLLACRAYINGHVRLSKRYHVKCLVSALFLSPESAFQSIPDTFVTHFFVAHFFVGGIQWGSDQASFSKDVLPRLTFVIQNLI